MYHDIVAAHGQLISGGINFAAKLLSHHSSPWMYIPYALLVIGAVGLQYLQMSRLNARNPQANQANPQAAMLQKYMPLIFGFIYLNVAAILNVYFIVSSAIRIGTQEMLFRRGIVPGPNSPARGLERKVAPAAIGEGQRGGDLRTGTPEGEGDQRQRCTLVQSQGRRVGGDGQELVQSQGRRVGGDGQRARSSSSNGNGSNSNGSEAADAAKKHPRSKAKKERKAR